MQKAPTGIEEAIRGVTDPVAVLQRIVDEATALLPAAEGAALLLLDGDEFTWVCAGGLMEMPPGTRMPTEGSISGQAIRKGTVLRADDARCDHRANVELATAKRIAAMVSVPLYYERQPIGCLVVSSPYPGVFRDDDVQLLTKLADFVSTAIATVMRMHRITAELLELGDEPQATRQMAGPGSLAQFIANVLRPGAGQDISRRQQIERVMQKGLSTCFQPIVELSTRNLVGAEALTRFGLGGRPDLWFADAHRLGVGVALEEAACRLALSHLDRLPADCYLAVNLSPRALASEDLRRLFDGLEAERIVIELTEQLSVEDYPSLRQAIGSLRRRGVRLAIDDTGSGFAGLSHIVRLSPDIIKLDLELTRGIDRDPVRHSLATALTAFAADTGAVVLAEGIETQGELACLLELGIPYGQGFLLGRPSAPAQLS